MKRMLGLAVLFLILVTSAYADPIDIGGFPPEPEIVASLLIEVLVVVGILWRFHLRLVWFAPIWLAVNFFTFYVLFAGIMVTLNQISPSHDYSLFAECVVVAVETVGLLWVSYLPFLKQSNSRPVTLWWALAASIAGNLCSIFAFIGIIALENAQR